MARRRGILVAMAVVSAASALPAGAQSLGYASLTHTVNVTVPSRVKIRVASLAASTPASSTNSVAQSGEGLSLTVSASQPWVLAARSLSDSATQKSQLQRSTDGRAQFSVIPSAVNGFKRGQPVLLTLTAP